MEIQKEFRKIVIITLLTFIYGCNEYYSKSPKKIFVNKDSLEMVKKYNALKEDSRRKDELLATLFDDYVALERELNLIDIETDEILLKEYKIIEVGLKSSTIDENTNDKNLSKFTAIRIMLEERNAIIRSQEEQLQELEQKIKIQENKLSNSNYQINGLNSFISALKERLKNKAQANYLLKVENESLIEKNKILFEELQSQIDENENLNERIELINLELNKKYLFLISSKEARVQEIEESSFLIYYKTNNIELLSFHPKSSYDLMDSGRNSRLIIKNETEFWQTSNNIIVRVKKRRL